MKIQFTVLFFLLTTLLYSQTKILSWNIENFGKSKTEQDIDFIANTIKNHDIIAIQEVVAGYGGAQAVVRLVDQLNRKGAKWDYSISNPTSSSAYKTERYAFIWKTTKAKLIGKPWLEKQYEKQIDREPYFATFEKNGKNFTIVSFHAITKSKQPETEIKYFKFLPQQYSNQNLIFVGDFNCPQSHTVFNPLKKMGYLPTLENQKTSLKQKCINNQCLASEYDNIFYHSTKIKIIDKGIIHFYKDFNSLKEARRISDHIPIWMEFSLN